MTFTLRELADRIGAELVGDPELAISGISSVGLAGPSDLVFALDVEWLAKASESPAGAVLAPAGSSSAKPMLLAPDVRAAVNHLLVLFERDFPPPPGVSPDAFVDPSGRVAGTAGVGAFACVMAGAIVGEGVRIHPFAYVGEECRIGAETVVYPHAVVMPRTVVGARCKLHAGCVIGEAGFGYRFEEGRHVPIPQVGHVILGDDVEVGANTTIDRATVGATVIGNGTKIDNLVQLAHNVQVGENCIIVAQSGVSGSTELGDHVVLGGQVGIVEHVKLASGVRMGAKAGVTKSISRPGDYWGTPARPLQETLETMAAAARVPKLIKEIRELRERLEKLEKRLG